MAAGEGRFSGLMPARGDHFPDAVDLRGNASRLLSGSAATISKPALRAASNASGRRIAVLLAHQDVDDRALKVSDTKPG